MSYSLAIMRPANESDDLCDPIEFDEWVEAVKAVDGIRFLGSDYDEATEDLVEVFIPDPKGRTAGKWSTIFEWTEEGYIEFKAGYDGAKHPVWRAASALAKKLSADIVGQDGEHYNLATAEPIE